MILPDRPENFESLAESRQTQSLADFGRLVSGVTRMYSHFVIGRLFPGFSSPTPAITPPVAALGVAATSTNFSLFASAASPALDPCRHHELTNLILFVGMELPQELLDEILSHLPKDDAETLRACSLVKRSWVYPAQRLLFSSIVLSARAYLLWGNKIDPDKTELLDHVRSFHYWAPNNKTSCLSTSDPIYGFTRYLAAFRRLRTLTLSDMPFSSITSNPSQEANIYSAFQHTLSSLSILECSISWSVFIQLIGYFPNLRNLEICNLHYGRDDRQPITLSRPLRGGLCITGFAMWALATFSDRLPRNQVAYDKLTISDDRIPPSATKYYQLIVNACGKSLVHLNFHPCECFPRNLPQWHKQIPTFNFPGNTVLDLSNCSELRQVVFYTVFPKEPQCAVISSITSRHIRKIVFTAPRSDEVSRTTLDGSDMLSLEDTMCGLVEKLRKLGYEHTLELEFKLHPDWVPLPIGKSFLKFGEKGRVLFSDTLGRTVKLTVRVSFSFVTRVSDLDISESGIASHCSWSGNTCAPAKISKMHVGEVQTFTFRPSGRVSVVVSIQLHHFVDSRPYVLRPRLRYHTLFPPYQ